MGTKNNHIVMKFIELGKEEQRDIIRVLKQRTNMSEQVIEKDWWVSAVLRALFALPYAERMSFKGGTSLSKRKKCCED